MVAANDKDPSVCSLKSSSPCFWGELSPTRKLPVDKHQGACVRRILLQLNSAYPWKDLFAQALHALRC